MEVEQEYLSSACVCVVVCTVCVLCVTVVVCIYCLCVCVCMPLCSSLPANCDLNLY